MSVRDDDVAIHRGLVHEVSLIEFPHAFAEETLTVSPRVSAAIITAEMTQIERCASLLRCRCLRHIVYLL
ncbi:hypothetical protein HMPREF2526_12315 [Corynebacterium sp. HMSC070E08]|nr:hypothetical protein HMPREF2526_12315 [Corynebacterium sp. HMSC070E08]OFQ58638.1 hypothetical protein HMPREF2932_06925 [Corynebacterium sp. HMSC074H12]PMC67863.1 hypothetical protein CJ201_12430 [Corynebacterium aurimucosum]